eukprot:109230-Alexandrium_andersonii.AAC.1
MIDASRTLPSLSGRPTPTHAHPFAHTLSLSLNSHPSCCEIGPGMQFTTWDPPVLRIAHGRGNS